MNKFGFLLVVKRSAPNGEITGQRMSINLYDTYESACVGCLKATQALNVAGWTVIITTMVNVTEHQTIDVSEGYMK